VDAQSVINSAVVGQLSWQYLRAPTLDRCSLSQRSWSSVYSIVLSRGSISDSWYLYTDWLTVFIRLRNTHNRGPIAEAFKNIRGRLSERYEYLSLLVASGLTYHSWRSKMMSKSKIYTRHIDWRPNRMSNDIVLSTTKISRIRATCAIETEPCNQRYALFNKKSRFQLSGQSFRLNEQ